MDSSGSVKAFHVNCAVNHTKSLRTLQTFKVLLSMEVKSIICTVGERLIDHPILLETGMMEHFPKWSIGWKISPFLSLP